MNNTNQLISDYSLRIGDTSLILGQRLGEWCGHGRTVFLARAAAVSAADPTGLPVAVASQLGRHRGHARPGAINRAVRTEAYVRRRERG